MIEAAVANFAEKSKPESSSTFIVYNLVVFDRSTNAVTRFPKRYSEFYDLHEKIKSLDPDIAGFPFPPKRTALANKQKLATDRKNAFNAYLLLLLRKDPLPLKVRQFLGLSPPSPTTTPIKTSEVVLASLSRMLSPGNKNKSKTGGDGDMHSAKVNANASRHDDETSMKIASVNGIKTTDGMTSSQGDGTGANGNGRKDNVRTTKSSGRVFTGKPRKRGLWATVRIPFFLFIGAVVLIASGWLFMQYISVNDVPRAGISKDPLTAVNSFDTLIVGEDATKSSSVKGNRKGNSNKRTKKSDKNGTKGSGKKRKGSKAAGTLADSILVDNNEGEGSSGTTTATENLGLDVKGQGKVQRKAATEKDTEKGSDFGNAPIGSEVDPSMGVGVEVGLMGVEVGEPGDTVLSTVTSSILSTNDDNDKINKDHDNDVLTRQKSVETTSTAPVVTEAPKGVTDRPIAVVHNDADATNDGNESVNDNDDNGHDSDNGNDSDSDSLSQSMSQKDDTNHNHDHATINDTTASVSEAGVLDSTSLSNPTPLTPSSPNQPPKPSAGGTGFITKVLIPFLVTCIATLSTLLSMTFSWIPWILRNSTGFNNRIFAVVAVILTGLFLLSHKISASLLGWYLRRILGADKKPGAFRLAISSLHFRFGWDRNDIVVDDFIWYNPPSFKSTPHFVRIGSITLRYNLQSVVMALINRKTHPITVHCVELEDVEMFMEKMEKTKDRSVGQRQHGNTLSMHPPSHCIHTSSRYTSSLNSHIPSRYTNPLIAYTHPLTAYTHPLSIHPSPLNTHIPSIRTSPLNISLH